jgi:hypothetical protein
VFSVCPRPRAVKKQPRMPNAANGTAQGARYGDGRSRGEPPSNEEGEFERGVTDDPTRRNARLRSSVTEKGVQGVKGLQAGVTE